MRTCVLYYARRRDNERVIKIGISTSLKHRLPVIGCSEIVALIHPNRKEAHQCERAAHTRFANDRIFGEWYWASDRLEEYIANLTKRNSLCWCGSKSSHLIAVPMSEVEEAA